MNYGAIPSNLFERLALLSGKVPVVVLDALASLLKARSLMAAARLGIFEALADGPATAGEVAERRGLDADTTELLLRSLAHFGYLKLARRRFALSKLSRTALLESAEAPFLGYLEWNYTQWDMLGRMEEVVVSGRGIAFHETMTDPAAWGSYQRAMLELARLEAPLVAAKIPVRKGALALLDVAGSHGLFGAELAKRHPPLRSTVLELPRAIAHARELAASAGIAHLVTHREGNLLEDDFGSGYDVVLLSNILHHFDRATNAEILAKAFACLNAEGTVAIWEAEAPNKDTKPSAGDIAALYFRLCSTAGCSSGEDYAARLEAAGFERIRVLRPLLAPGQVLVMGRRGAGSRPHR